MRILIVLLIVMMATPGYGRSKRPPELVGMQDEAVDEFHAPKLKMETPDSRADSAQKRRHREVNQLQRQIFVQQELSRRQKRYSQEQKVQQQRTSRQNETRLLGW